jgi:hypothetical protein
VLIDAVDRYIEVLMAQLKEVSVDYVISQCRQDHSGSILCPGALSGSSTTSGGQGHACRFLHIAEDKFITIVDGESLSLATRR